MESVNLWFCEVWCQWLLVVRKILDQLHLGTLHRPLEEHDAGESCALFCEWLHWQRRMELVMRHRLSVAWISCADAILLMLENVVPSVPLIRCSALNWECTVLPRIPRMTSQLQEIRTLSNFWRTLTECSRHFAYILIPDKRTMQLPVFVPQKNPLIGEWTVKYSL